MNLFFVQILNVDRMVISDNPSARKKPILGRWNTYSLRERESKEISLGGFGQGRLRDPTYYGQKKEDEAVVEISST